MKISEILTENQGNGPVPKDLEDKSMGGMVRMRDVGGYDRAYHLNRIMMATAMADGRSKKPVDMDAASFVEKYNVAVPYSDLEELMMYQAMATIPTDAKELIKRGKSQESSDTNATSPVPQNSGAVRKKPRK